MNLKVKEKLEVLDSQRQELLLGLENIDDNEGNMKLEDEGWTLMQTYYHLYIVEKLLHYDMKKRLEKGTVRGNVGLREKFNYLLLKIFLKLPFKYKAPKALIKEIPESISIEELKANWESIVKLRYEALENIDDELVQKKLIVHPRIGFINIIQALEFIPIHHRHHYAQLKRQMNKIKASVKQK